MLSNRADVVTIILIQMSSAGAALSQVGLETAVDTAMLELNWTYPISASEKILWLLKRSVRHASYILWMASAQKFKYKQVNLQHRFDHYEILIKHMDVEYEKALASASSIFSSISAYKMFGTAVGAGFIYDSIGKDITYDTFSGYLSSEV